MAEQKIEFRKIRDFGENLNDTFLFIRMQFKPLLASFFAICGVLMVIQAILYGIYQSGAMGGLGDLLSGRKIRENRVSDILNVGYFSMIFSMWITFVAMQVAFTAYIKLYVENNGNTPSIEDVWSVFKQYFFKILLYGIPITLLTLIGFVFCLAPGVWLAVVWVPFVFIVMMEDKDFGNAFSRCFEIVKENFWSSFAVYLVAFLVYNFSSGIVGLVVGAIAGVIAYLSTKDISTTVGIVTSFLNIFSYTFYIVYLVSIAFHYFTLVEKRDGTGLLSRIDSIGTKDSNFNNIEEEY